MIYNNIYYVLFVLSGTRGLLYVACRSIIICINNIISSFRVLKRMLTNIYMRPIYACNICMYISFILEIMNIEGARVSFTAQVSSVVRSLTS